MSSDSDWRMRSRIQRTRINIPSNMTELSVQDRRRSSIIQRSSEQNCCSSELRWFWEFVWDVAWMLLFGATSSWEETCDYDPHLAWEQLRSIRGGGRCYWGHLEHLEHLSVMIWANVVCFAVKHSWLVVNVIRSASEKGLKKKFCYKLDNQTSKTITRAQKRRQKLW